MPSYDYAREVTFHLFSLPEGGHVNTPLYSSDGRLLYRVSVEHTGGDLLVTRMLVSGESRQRWSLLLRSIGEITACESGDIRTTDLGTLITFDGAVDQCLIRL